MPRDRRLQFINDLEQARASRVIAYLTSDRRGADAKIASDAIPWLYSHLREIGHVPRLDLFLYSSGGGMMAGYRIAKLMRGFCDRFSVLIPAKAHSAATLIALAADEICMLGAGELGPVDPQIQSPFNPSPRKDMPPAPVEVESVAGYFNLVDEEIGRRTDPEGLRQALAVAFDKLADKVHPLALGGVYRARQQIGMLAKKLLKEHMEDAETIDRIVEAVTRELLSHDYPITKPEATDIGLPVIQAVDPYQEQSIWSLYEDYQDKLRLLEPYNPEVELGTDDSCDTELDYALVESGVALDTYRVVKRLRRREAPLSLQPGQSPILVPAVEEQIVDQAWKRRSDG